MKAGEAVEVPAVVSNPSEMWAMPKSASADSPKSVRRMLPA